MKKLLYACAFIVSASAAFSSCDDNNDTWNDYAEWRNANINWYIEQSELKNSDGTPFYTTLNPDWYANSGVLIHYFNDRDKTLGNLSPLSTSRVTVKYKGMLYDGTVFDATTAGTPDSVRTFSLSGLVSGWKVALTDMRVGDSCDVVIPYTMGYGANGSGGISPYSTLKFSIKLVDIPAYEIP